MWTTYFEGKEHPEPAQHIWALRLTRAGISAEFDTGLQYALEISSQPVTGLSSRDVEDDFGEARVAYNPCLTILAVAARRIVVKTPYR